MVDGQARGREAFVWGSPVFIPLTGEPQGRLVLPAVRRHTPAPLLRQADLCNRFDLAPDFNLVKPDCRHSVRVELTAVEAHFG